MISNFAYITSIILASFLGMSYLGLRYYKKRYTDIKSKYDSIGGDDYVALKEELAKTKKLNVSLLEKNKISKLRKGLIKKTFFVNNDSKQPVNVECEVIECERTRNKSRIEVVRVNCTELLQNSRREQVIELVNGWYESSKIEWFQVPLDELREDKIDELLKDK